MPAQDLAIIAGNGSLPCLVYARYPDAMILRLGEGDVRPGRTGDLLKALRAKGIKRLCMIGGLKRPSWLSLWPSWESWKLVFKYGFGLSGGDDALLGRVRRVMEGEGFTMVGMRSLCPDLLVEEGVMVEGEGMPSPDDCKLYIEQAKTFGKKDKGQAIVIINNRIVDTEDSKGTDALILRNPRSEAILVKAAKPQQDMDLDLPTIGPATIERAGLASFRAIVVEAGRTLIVDKDRCIALARQHNLSLIGARW